MASSKRLDKKKGGKVKGIYTPRPGDDSDNPDLACEQQGDFANEDLFGRYDPIRELGRGAYGVVYESKVLQKRAGLEQGSKIALKKVKRVFNTTTDCKRLLRELRILRILRNHDNIVTLYDVLPPLDPKGFATLTTVFEFLDSDLGKIFRTYQFFTSLHVQYIMYQILLGLKFMHSAHIVHRDLKPANILINEDCSIKICDFGLARGFSEKAAQLPDDDAKAPDAQDDEKTESESSSKKKRLSRKSKKMKRAITRHVVTRWYRGPEVILLQQKQDTLAAVDMWSMGAIFAELLQMQKDTRPNPSNRKPLFPGETCFPLSLKGKNDHNSKKDQMQLIFSVIGSPKDEEIDKITDERARKYLRGIPHKTKTNLKKLFPGADSNALDFFTQLLMFDVDKRMNVDQALEHPYLKAVRDPVHERAQKRVEFSFENGQLDQENYRELILEEVIQYNPDHADRLSKSGAMPNYKK